MVGLQLLELLFQPFFVVTTEEFHCPNLRCQLGTIFDPPGPLRSAACCSFQSRYATICRVNGSAIPASFSRSNCSLGLSAASRRTPATAYLIESPQSSLRLAPFGFIASSIEHLFPSPRTSKGIASAQF